MTINFGFGTIKNRIAAQFMGMAAVLLAVAYLALSWLNSAASESDVANRLMRGESEVARAVAHLREHTETAALVLARSAALRAALAVDDPTAWAGALRDNGYRFELDFVVVVRDSRVLAAAGGTLPAGGPIDLHAGEIDLAVDSGKPGPVSGLVALPQGRLALASAVALPEGPSGSRLVAGIELGEQLARRLQSEAAADITLVRQRADGQWDLLASTLSPAAAEALRTQALQRFSRSPEGEIDLAGSRYAFRRAPLPSPFTGDVQFGIVRSVDSLQGPFQTLQYLFLGLLSAILLLWALGSLAVARRLADPMKALAELATRIRAGDYSGSAQITTRDEIGRLARTLEDMQGDIAKRESRIQQLAYHDPLTGLPNRASFIQHLEAALADPAREQRPLGVLLMGLDRFQTVNDALGHNAGDALLGFVARRLKTNLGEHRLVARTGGDEFGVLVEPGTAQETRNVAERLLRSMEQPIAVAGQDVTLAASVGVALHPRHGTDGLSLLRSADSAMRAAKTTRTGMAIYDPGEAVRSELRLSLLGELRDAVARDELALVFEPKLDLRGSGRLCAEGLLRWDHPKRGRVSPAEFIPFAEQTGFITALTEWVLRTGVHHAASWSSAGTPIQIALNASTRDLQRRELPALVRELIHELGLPPELLCLEITESGFMENPTQAAEILWRLNEIGVKLAIDDYGTGYSSLAYLKRLPVSELKIDRTFVAGIVEQRDSRTIVQSTIDLGHNLGMTVTAEGVETVACLDLLRAMGCDRAQGYFVCRALPAAQVAHWFSERQATQAAEATQSLRRPLNLVVAG